MSRPRFLPNHVRPPTAKNSPLTDPPKTAPSRPIATAYFRRSISPDLDRVVSIYQGARFFPRLPGPPGTIGLDSESLGQTKRSSASPWEYQPRYGVVLFARPVTRRHRPLQSIGTDRRPIRQGSWCSVRGAAGNRRSRGGLHVSSIPRLERPSQTRIRVDEQSERRDLHPHAAFRGSL